MARAAHTPHSEFHLVREALLDAGHPTGGGRMAALDRIEEQFEAANERKQELWTRLLDMEGKYLDALERLCDECKRDGCGHVSSPASRPE